MSARQLRKRSANKMSSPTSTISTFAAEWEAEYDSDSQYASLPDFRNRSGSLSPPDTNSANNSPRAAPTTKTTVAGVQRRPTRRPDPLVNNRNALMARENRRKKRERMTYLEQNSSEKDDTIRSLRGQVQAHSTRIHKLQDECLYLRSVLANQPAIAELLRQLRGIRMPMTSSLLGMMVADAAGQPSNSGNSSSSQPHSRQASTMWSDSREQSVSTEDFESLGSIFNSPAAADDTSLDAWLTTQQLELPSLSLWQPEMAFHEADGGQSSGTASVDGDEQQQPQQPPQPQPQPQQQAPHPQQPDQAEECMSVSNEHNYFQNHTNQPAQSASQAPAPSIRAEQLRWGGKRRPAAGGERGPGICLHVSDGRVSLELCGSCHRQAQNAWDEEGDEL